jgi:N-ethylmaleimide reductase
MPHENLLRPLTAGILATANRVWMAPLTRSRATMPGNTPNGLNTKYYRQRADRDAGAGLIISEATPICPMGHGYYATPGIHTDAQQAGWKQVTDAVHGHGGLIVCQLWHVGRVSNSALLPGNQAPVSTTTEPSRSKTYIDHSGDRVPASPPRKLDPSELPAIVDDYASAAERSIAAGFDGVEIHGANTYLLDQFTRDGMNTMAPPWGGSLENRLRFPLLVALADGLGAMGLAFLHAVETWDRSKIDPRVKTVIPQFAKAF